MKYALCILLLICGCKSETSTESTDVPENESTSEVIPDVSQPIDQNPASDVTAANGMFQLEDDDIGGYPFEQDLNTILTSLSQAEIMKKPIQNIHDSTKTDTLVRVVFGPSTIEYYRSQAGGSSLILGANIQSNDVNLKKGIKIGMRFSDFASLFEEIQGKENLTTVIISTMEGLNQSVFLFENEMLSTVRYESYID